MKINLTAGPDDVVGCVVRGAAVEFTLADGNTVVLPMTAITSAVAAAAACKPLTATELSKKLLETEPSEVAAEGVIVAAKALDGSVTTYVAINGPQAEVAVATWRALSTAQSSGRHKPASGRY